MEGGRRASMLLALAAALAVGCGSDDDCGPSVRVADPVAAFAPEVAFDPEDPSFPMSTDYFLDHSTLEWSNGQCLSEVNIAAGRVSQRETREGAPRLRPARLGGPDPYRHAPLEDDCETRRGPTYTTAQHTRPYDRGRPPGLAFGEGFHLDVLVAAYYGEKGDDGRGDQADLARAPAYYEIERADVDGDPGVRISYWLLWGIARSSDRSGDDVAMHEGGWQRVDVALVRGERPNVYQPVGIRLYGDGGVGAGRDVGWGDLEVAEGDGTPSTHPVLYAATGSHTLHSSPGRYERVVTSPERGRAVAIDVAAPCGRCMRWRTWRALRPVHREPWYGFGGAWGVEGPLGPSPF